MKICTLKCIFCQYNARRGEQKKTDMRAQNVEKNQRQRKKHEPNKNKEKHIKFGMDLRIYGAQNL